MHLGHVYAAWYASVRAGSQGRFLLRIEDIDASRCRENFAAGFIEDLTWLGFSPMGEIRVQSRHLPEYAAALDFLRDEKLLYPCFCSRADIAREVAAAAGAPHAPDGGLVYLGICRGLDRSLAAERIAAGEPHAWRLNMAQARARLGNLTFYEEQVGALPCEPERFGDVVLGRRDAPCSYHLCVTHDDAAQGVTLVTRGQDLQAATSVHRVLQGVFGWAVPRYAHHLLVLGGDGQRLSKRNGATSIAQLRQQGLTPEAVREMACLRRPGLRPGPAGARGPRPH
jgi:glutamyl-Q tRNA(Asp) synthetase